MRPHALLAAVSMVAGCATEPALDDTLAAGCGPNQADPCPPWQARVKTAGCIHELPRDQSVRTGLALHEAGAGLISSCTETTAGASVGVYGINTTYDCAQIAPWGQFVRLSDLQDLSVYPPSGWSGQGDPQPLWQGRFLRPASVYSVDCGAWQLTSLGVAGDYGAPLGVYSVSYGSGCSGSGGCVGSASNSPWIQMIDLRQIDVDKSWYPRPWEPELESALGLVVVDSKGSPTASLATYVGGNTIYTHSHWDESLSQATTLAIFRADGLLLGKVSGANVAAAGGDCCHQATTGFSKWTVTGIDFAGKAVRAAGFGDAHTGDVVSFAMWRANSLRADGTTVLDPAAGLKLVKLGSVEQIISNDVTPCRQAILHWPTQPGDSGGGLYHDGNVVGPLRGSGQCQGPECSAWDLCH